MSAKTTKILDGKFEIVGIQPGKVSVYGFGIVSLDDTLTEELAKQLVLANCPYLRMVPKEK